MLPDEQPVEYILDGIDAVMASRIHPKVILFDIGGVVVSASDSCYLFHNVFTSFSPKHPGKFVVVFLKVNWSNN